MVLNAHQGLIGSELGGESREHFWQEKEQLWKVWRVKERRERCLPYNYWDLSTQDSGEAKPFWLNGEGSHWEDLGLDKMNNIERIWSKRLINLFLNIGHLFISSFSENIDWDKEKWKAS